MSVQQMEPGYIEHVCSKLSYIPTRNVVGLRNGTACILYDNWCPNSVCVHSYIPEPKFLTKGFLREMFRYPFSNVDWAIGVTPGDNTKALEFNRRIGLREVYRLPGGFSREVDQVFQIMHHSECKYWRRPAD